jgi:hypothetical protein
MKEYYIGLDVHKDSVFMAGSDRGVLRWYPVSNLPAKIMSIAVWGNRLNFLLSKISKKPLYFNTKSSPMPQARTMTLDEKLSLVYQSWRTQKGREDR